MSSPARSSRPLRPIANSSRQRRSARWWLPTVGLLLLPAGVRAETITAATCAYDDVSEAVGSALPGDTVLVPAGACTWSSQLSISTGIELMGAGMDHTTITGDHDDFLMVYDPSDYSLDAPFRLSGFTFDFDGRGPGLSLGVAKAQPFTIQTRVRIDHNRFMNAAGQLIKHWGMRGVVDHNRFEGTTYPLRANAAEGADGTPIGQSWWNNLPGIEFGAPDNNLYFEDNSFSGLDSESGIWANCQYGGRHVLRYNTVTVDSNKWPLLDMHGERNDGGAYCACFGGEIYGNRIEAGSYDIAPFLDQRGGKVVNFFNSINTTGDTFTRVRDEEDTEWCADTNAQPNDVSETYIWLNRQNYDGALVTVSFGGGGDQVIEDAEAWQFKTDFDGSSGIGCGTVAQMNAITTCTAGVAFWATDQSCSDLTGLVGQDPATPISGTLYRCGAANDWVPYFTPLPYPHPLISGSAGGGGTGGSGAAAGHGSTTGGGGASSSGGAGGATSVPVDPNAGGGDSGCGCRLRRRGGRPGGMVWVVLGLLGVCRRLRARGRATNGTSTRLRYRPSAA